jgi:hypothetical protein
MTRLYARALGGGRIHESTPDSRWKILTILGALSTRGMIAAMTIEEATDGDIFLAYLDHCLCPQLRAGDVVVMDNLSSHKIAGVEQRIEKCGAELLYLPPYSPDLTPHREGLVEAERITSRGQSKNQRSTRKSHHGTAASDHPGECVGMVRTLHRKFIALRETLY